MITLMCEARKQAEVEVEEIMIMTYTLRKFGRAKELTENLQYAIGSLYHPWNQFSHDERGDFCFELSCMMSDAKAERDSSKDPSYRWISLKEAYDRKGARGKAQSK